MSDLSDLACAACGTDLERLNYHPRQMLTAADLRSEQAYWREKARRHNRYLHGWGVVCGCEVQPLPQAKGWQVRVCPGYAVSPQGDEILIDACVDIDLKLGGSAPPCTVRWPCPPLGEMPGTGAESRAVAYIAVRHAECMTRPVSVHPAGCGCDETGCEYSRVRESWEVKVLWELPESHRQAMKDDDAWCEAIRKTPKELMQRLHTYPVPPCPPCTDEPWVVLAEVFLPKAVPAMVDVAGMAAVGMAQAQPALQVSYLPRRVLLATQRLQVAALCLP